MSSCTSRIAGYRSARLDGTFTHYIVQEMDDQQIRRFLDVWCPAVEAAQTPDLSLETRMQTAQQEIQGIMHAIQDTPGVRRLVANPLLLRILALIHRTGAQLPQKRIELYKLAADTLARTWRIAQGVAESVLVEEGYLTRLLGKLAYWLHTTKPTGIATEQEVYRELGQEWTRIRGLSWDEDNLEIQKEIKTFLRQVREHTGLFVERAPRRYGSMHLTFEEYYAARYLVARSRTRARLLRTHLHNSRWDEPILLALGFVGLDSPDDASELVETAILAQGEEAEDQGFAPSKHEDVLGRDYLFALHCLGDQIPVNPRTMKQLIMRLVDELLHENGSMRYQRYQQAIRERLNALKGSKAALLLASQLQTALSDTDPLVQHRAAIRLIQLGERPLEVFSILDRSLYNRDKKIRLQAVESFMEAEQLSNAALRRLIDIYCDTRGKQDPVFRIAQTLVNKLHAIPSSFFYDLLATEKRWRFHTVASLLHLVEEQEYLKLQDKFIRVLHHKNGEIRRIARIAIRFIKPEILSPRLIHSLYLRSVQEKNPKFRCSIIATLWMQGFTSYKNEIAMIKMLTSKNTHIRIAALKACDTINTIKLQHKPQRVIAKIFHALHDKNLQARRHAIRVLSRLSPELDITKIILPYATNSDHFLEMIEGMVRLETGRQKILTILRQYLHQDEALIRYKTAYNLKRLGEMDQDVISVLCDALGKSEIIEIQLEAANLIGAFGQGNIYTIEELRHCLTHNNSSLRAICAVALARLGQRFPATQKDIGNMLRNALVDPDFNQHDIRLDRSYYDDVFDILWQLVNPETQTSSLPQRRTT